MFVSSTPFVVIGGLCLFFYKGICSVLVIPSYTILLIRVTHNTSCAKLSGNFNLVTRSRYLHSYFSPFVAFSLCGITGIEKTFPSFPVSGPFLLDVPGVRPLLTVSFHRNFGFCLGRFFLWVIEGGESISDVSFAIMSPESNMATNMSSKIDYIKYIIIYVLNNYSCSQIHHRSLLQTRYRLRLAYTPTLITCTYGLQSKCT